jgi:hypothetical protein
MLTQTLERPGTLDTLAQLTHTPDNPEELLLKKVKRKALTTYLSGNLIALNSINIQSYRNMYYCNSVLLQEDQQLTTSYCKHRFCLICNSIRTANLINGYLPQLKKFENPYFLTLTIRAVKAKYLPGTLSKMLKDFRTIMQHITKYRGMKIKAIRSIEINYNEKEKTYNPHLHFIIDGLHEATVLRYFWIAINCYVTPEGRIIQNADDKAQDIRFADHNSATELFKYVTKTISKTGLKNLKALDVIYTAIRNRRLIQPINLEKEIDEDEREAIVYENLSPGQKTFEYIPDAFDWIDLQTGECLTGYTPKNGIKSLFEILRE